jgi:hypothetical protein
VGKAEWLLVRYIICCEVKKISPNSVQKSDFALMIISDQQEKNSASILNSKLQSSWA